MVLALKYHCELKSCLIYFKGACLFPTPNAYTLPSLFTRKEILGAEVEAKRQCPQLQNEPLWVNTGRKASKAPQKSAAYCGFFCDLILKQSICFDIFQLIGIFRDILWGFQSWLKSFLKDGGMKLLYLLFPMQLLLRKLALCQENRRNTITLLSWVANPTSDSDVLSGSLHHQPPL